MATEFERPELFATGGCWSLYDRLIDGVDESAIITDYAFGANWSYVDSEAGCGVSFSASGGARRGRGSDLRGMKLKDVACLAKSWCFEDASLGVAALNAWYNNRQRIEDRRMTADFEEPDTVGYDVRRQLVGEKLDAFDLYRPSVEELGLSKGSKPKVTVVGHFPHVERICEYADLVVLERKCSDGLDTPDPACEYVLPGTDFAFITGVTLINKTAPRLLQLARGARVCMVGPSVVMSPELFYQGAETLSGSIVVDPEELKFSVKRGYGRLFGRALKMCTVCSHGTPALARSGTR